MPPITFSWPLNFPIPPSLLPVGINNLNPGASNDSALDVLSKHWPVAIQGLIANGLIAGLAAGDQTNFNNAALIFDQLFRSTASSFYLDKRMADFGVIRTPNVGISDSVFRQLGLVITNKKLIMEALLEVLNAFYGQDSCRAFVASTQPEPYNIQVGSTLLLSIDGGPQVTIPFGIADFAQAGSVKAVEVAATITHWLTLNGYSTAYALPFLDPNSGQNTVKIYSGALGLQGSVQVLGGLVQNLLQFPTLLTQSDVGNSWVITQPSVPGIFRFTLSSNATTTDLTKVHIGDYVNIFGQGFSLSNKGTYTITRVDVRYISGTLTQFFEVKNSSGAAQASAVIYEASDMMFYRPFRSTVNNAGSRAVIAVAVTPQEVNVQLPTTTIAVSRGPLQAAYLNAQPALNVASLIRQPDGIVSVTTSTNHGMAPGNWIFVDTEVPAPTPPANIAGNGTTTTNANPTTIWTGLGNAPGVAVEFCRSVSLQDGRAFFAGGEDATPAWHNDARTVTISSPVVQANGGTSYTYALTSVAPVPITVSRHGMSVLTDANQNGNVLLTGGSVGGAPFNSAYIYNVTGNSWSANIPFTTPRLEHNQITLDDNRVLIMGGRDNALVALKSVEAFTPTIGGGTWSAAPVNMLFKRGAQATVQMSDGKLLVVGGYQDSLVASSTCEVYNPIANTTTQTGNMSYCRFYHSLVWLPGDLVLVIGGVGGLTSNYVPGVSSNVALSSAEIYDYASGRWYPAGRTTVARGNPQAFYLSSTNKVVVFGDDTSVDYFDVATRTWKKSPSNEPVARVNGAGAATSFNTIVFGFGAIGGVVSRSIDLFQPAGDEISNGNINGMRRIATTPGANLLTFQTAEGLSYTADAGAKATILSVNEKPATTIIGPYVWDTVDGPAIGAVFTNLTQNIRAGQQYSKLAVSSTVGFPDGDGYLCLGFGTSSQFFPIHYVGVIDTVTLSIDYGTMFPIDIPLGAEVTLLTQKGPFTPLNPTQLGSYYLTDSASGRISAIATINAIMGAGIVTDIDIVYPGDRGLGGEGQPISAASKLSDKVEIWASDQIDADVAAARAGEDEVGEAG